MDDSFKDFNVSKNFFGPTLFGVDYQAFKLVIRRFQDGTHQVGIPNFSFNHELFQIRKIIHKQILGQNRISKKVLVIHVHEGRQYLLVLDR